MSTVPCTFYTMSHEVLLRQCPQLTDLALNRCFSWTWPQQVILRCPDPLPAMSLAQYCVLQESCKVSPLEMLLPNHAHMVHMLQW